MNPILLPQDITVPQHFVKDAAALQLCMYEAATSYSVSDIVVGQEHFSAGRA